MNRIKYSKKFIEELRSMCTFVTIAVPGKKEKYNEYIYLPFWFKTTNNPDELIAYGIDEIPDDLKEAILQDRGILKNHSGIKNPLTKEECDEK